MNSGQTTYPTHTKCKKGLKKTVPDKTCVMQNKSPREGWTPMSGHMSGHMQWSLQAGRVWWEEVGQYETRLSEPSQVQVFRRKAEHRSQASVSHRC